jgi:hypothetical protein
MKHLLLCGLAVSLLAPGGFGQDSATKEQIRLQVEVSRNGAVTDTWTVRTTVGTAVTIPITSQPTLSLTPTRVDAETLNVRIDAKASTAKQPAELDLRGHEPGSVSMALGRDSIELKMSLLR